MLPCTLSFSGWEKLIVEGKQMMQQENKEMLCRTTISNAPIMAPQGLVGDITHRLEFTQWDLSLDVELVQSTIQPLTIMGLPLEEALTHVSKQC